MGMKLPARMLLLTFFVAVSIVIVGGGRTASACSCASIDPIDAMTFADVVFTGTVIAETIEPDVGDMSPLWTFAVDGVVKGDVGERVDVVGDLFCGTDLSVHTSSIAVFASVVNRRLQVGGCLPSPSRVAFEAALGRAAEAATFSRSGTPAALVAGQIGATNLAVLDSDGATIVRAQLPVAPGAITHCPGTSLVAVWSQGDSGGATIATTHNVMSLVDLQSMTVIETRSIVSEFVGVQDQMVCLDGGARVVVSRGFGPNDGRITVATSNTDVTVDRTATFIDISRALIHPSGTIVLVPSGAGGVLTTLSSDNFEPLGTVELDPSLAATDGAFSPTADRLAVLVTTSGRDMQYDTGATHVLVLDVIDGVAQAGTAVQIALPAGGDGAAKRIAWIDNDTWIVDRETDSTKIMDFVSVDGELLSSSDVGWGWGLVELSDSVLRARGGGLELIDTTGASTGLSPSPGNEIVDRQLFVAPMVDAPPIDFSRVPDIDTPTLRPVDGVVNPDAVDVGGVGAAPPSGESGTQTELPETPGQEDAAPQIAPDVVPDVVETNGTWAALPIFSIGGLVVIGGLIAVRNEFGNWRRRKLAKQSATPPK